MGSINTFYKTITVNKQGMGAVAEGYIGNKTHDKDVNLKTVMGSITIE